MKNERIDYLDGWRGLAIIFVLISHFLGVRFIDAGRLGVDVFFVLSGMLMSNILFVKRTPLPVFYQRRVSRILPVFLLYVGVVFSLAALFSIKTTPAEFWSTLFFLRTYLPNGSGIWDSSLPVGHLWSLNVEEHSYIILSIFTLVITSTKKNAVALLSFGLLFIAFSVVYTKYPASAPINSLLRTECAASFIFLSAGYFLVRRNLAWKINPWLPLATFIGAILCYAKLAPWWCSFLVSPFLLAFTVNHLGETKNFILQLMSIPPLRAMGVWSYSVYLWQQPFYMYKDELSLSPLGALLIAMVVGVLSFYLFENPVRMWLNKFEIRVHSIICPFCGHTHQKHVSLCFSCKRKIPANCQPAAG